MFQVHTLVNLIDQALTQEAGYLPREIKLDLTEAFRAPVVILSQPRIRSLSHVERSHLPTLRRQPMDGKRAIDLKIISA